MAGMRIEGKGQRRQRGQVRGWQSRRVQSRTYTEPLVPGPADNTEVVNLVNRPITPPKCVKLGGKGCGPIDTGIGPQPGNPDKTQPEYPDSLTPGKTKTTRPPTFFPTNAPTRSPSPTADPTAAPTDFPTRFPSLPPTDFPTPFPTTSPTNFPTKSPSAFPTTSPTTSFPSHIPSDSPSRVASSLPSGVPSTSIAPSLSAFVTIPVDENGNPIPDGTGEGNGSDTGGNSTTTGGGGDAGGNGTTTGGGGDSGGNGTTTGSGGDAGGNSTTTTTDSGGGAGALSECAEGPANKTGAMDAKFTFQYVMILKSTGNADRAVMEIEPLMHRQLGVEFLTCNFQARRRLQQNESSPPFELIELNSLPVDKVSTESCSSDDVEPSDAGSNCFLVDAGFSASMFLKGSSEEVVQTFGDFLTQLMSSGRWNETDSNIQRLAFRGFPEGTVLITSTPTTGGSENVSGAQSVSNAALVGGIVGGTIAVVIAAGAALVLMLLLVKRYSRNETYLKHIDDASIFSIDQGSETTLSAQEGPNAVFVHDDDSRTSSNLAATAAVIQAYEDNPETWGHDVKTCKSSTCAVCQADRLQMPTFVPADVMAANTARDLGPARPPDTKRGYTHDDTVNL
jgi:hypothetical protein